MIVFPTNLVEIDKLIDDKVQESIHLDYKHGGSIDKDKKDDVAKDVSAFANSDGGVLIYGVSEKDFVPTKKTGVDHTKYKREWLEQVIWSNISPIIDEVLVVQIPFSATTSIYSVRIPKSYRGPHQASDKRYYRRFNSISVPMEDYEINDVRNRRNRAMPLVNIDLYIRRKSIVYIVVTNIGEVTAEDVTFDLPKELLPWIDKQDVKLFKNGIKSFPPKRTYSFNYGLINALVHKDSRYPPSFNITASYGHAETGQRISDVFHIDLMDYWGSSILESEMSEQWKEIRDSLNKLTGAVDKLNGYLSKIGAISGATGLDLSVTSIKNLKHVVAGDNQIEKIDPTGLDYNVFMEVLGVDSNTALQVRDFFWSGNDANGLRDVKGVTVETVRKIKKHFLLKGRATSNSQ